MTGRTVFVAIAVLLLLGTWPLLAVAVRRLHALPRRLGGPRRPRALRTQSRSDRAFARRHNIPR